MDVKRLPNEQINRKAWDTFVAGSPQGSVYALSSFLDKVFPDWEGLIYPKEEKWLAIWPIFPNKKGFIKTNLQPPFTQHAGIMFCLPEGDTSHQHYQIKCDILKAFLRQLPPFHLFSLNFSPQFDYPLPFYWEGYKLHTRYTYQVDLLNEPPAFHQLRENHQRTIKKALKKNLQPEKIKELKAFMGLVRSNLVKNQKVLDQKGYAVLEKLTGQMLKQGKAFLKGIRNEDGYLEAAMLFMAFENKLYYLIGTATPEAKNKGAMALLLWQALEEAYGQYEVFDFEGSMIPSIEHFFRGFGAKPVPYLCIYKNQLPLQPLWAMFGY